MEGGGGGGGGGGSSGNSGGNSGASSQIPSQGPPADANTALVQDPRSPLYNRYNTLNAGHGPLRDQILTQTARGVGTRQGFAEELQHIDDLLDHTYAPQLDARYDFSSVVINRHLVPPVITELHNVQEEVGPRFLYLTLGSFRIVKQARLAAEIPNWRHYLYANATKNFTQPTIYPMTTDEQSVWNRALEEGKAIGVHEARATFSQNFDRLARDFDGMRLYQDLAHKGAVSLPVVDVARRKIRLAEGDTRAFVGEEIVTMRIEPKFKAKPKAFR